MSPGLWGFQLLPPRLVRLLHKNKHGQRKFWYFVLRPNDGPQKTAKIGTVKLKFLVYLMNKSARIWRNVYNFTKKIILFHSPHNFRHILKNQISKKCHKYFIFEVWNVFCLKLLPYLHYWANWLMRSTKKLNLKISIFAAF